jgi:hypothetical protein
MYNLSISGINLFVWISQILPKTGEIQTKIVKFGIRALQFFGMVYNFTVYSFMVYNFIGL